MRRLETGAGASKHATGMLPSVACGYFWFDPWLLTNQTISVSQPAVPENSSDFFYSLPLPFHPLHWYKKRTG